MTRRRLLTSGQLADELGVSPRTVARYVRNGWLTPTMITLGGHYRWDLAEVQATIRAERRKRAHEDTGRIDVVW